MLLDQIPGLKRARETAIAREESLRRRAFMPCALRLCGIDVHPFTPRHFLILDEAANPLIGGAGTVMAEHVAQFLWIVSTAFVFPTRQLSLREVKQRRGAFAARLRRVPYLRARRQIKAYLDEAWFDAPPGDGSHEAPIASTAAFLIDRFAASYHWPAETLDVQGQPVHGGGTLDWPFAQLFQLNRLISVRTDRDYHPANPLSDRVERECVRQWVARQKKRRKP